MEQKFTPGPWRRNTRRDILGQCHVYGRPHPIDGGDYAPICTARSPEDADLIAAAPELLDALQDAMRWFAKLEDWRGVGDPNIEKYRAAIAKATGRE